MKATPRLSPILLVGLFLLMGVIARTAPEAKEATKRGRNATIVWLDEKGARHETRGGEIRYGYFTRAQLGVPRDGKSYRDDEHQITGLSFARVYMKFSKIKTIDFQYENTGDPVGTRLVLTITPHTGKPFTESGNTLVGAAHPASPFIAFRVDGVERRIELFPLGTAQDRGGRPRIISADFKL